MIEIKTYIGRKDLRTYKKNKDSADAFFVSATSGEALDVIRSISSRNLDRYLNGAIIIKVDQHELTTFSDWDDLDLLWTGLVTMVLEYLQNGGYGATQLSMNGVEWSLKKAQSKTKSLILFHSKRPNAFYDGRISTPVSLENKAALSEMEFLRKVVSSAEDFWSLREKDTRTQNLAAFAEKHKELKHRVLEQGTCK
ncbi:hypothetical protein [Planomicrobium sp. CPCC 101110]|uniref:hypothetical protein n=1 Tax=Planomicrobium sp. CPCC 101110 TaxID=2599619 RepID=UPI0011B6DBA7|nr:hypothetical protein [Planomicrobium sp. CPCC 101110]TWT26031.1 hypothetical protein FQV30_09580 [Planomicrobium sp. CPCC 101110]